VRKNAAPARNKNAAPARKKQTRRPAPRRAAPLRPRSVPPEELPLGYGVGDAFAVQRLQVPRARPNDGLREVGWAEFPEIARSLAERIAADYAPDVVLGVMNGGVFLGGALAVPLKADFHPVKVTKKGKRSISEPVTDVRRKRVLVVDDVTMSGKTLAAVCAAARRAGARETRTATIVVRPTRNHGDYHVMETDDIVVFGWDYQLHGGGHGGADDPGNVGV
jgi:hypoxanthine phosphoribosyltransferase